jgi:hypothetical protein
MTTVVAIAILAAFLVAAYGVGRVLGGFEEARLKAQNARVWAPLAPLIGVMGSHDSGRLAGTYRGRGVRARRGEKNPAEHGSGYNFEVEMDVRSGGQEWRVDYAPAFVVFGARRGEVRSPDEALRARLAHAGVVALIDGIGSEKIVHVAYLKKQNAIVLNEDVRPGLVPAPQRFAAHLDLLARLAEIHERVDPAA